MISAETVSLRLTRCLFPIEIDSCASRISASGCSSARANGSARAGSASGAWPAYAATLNRICTTSWPGSAVCSPRWPTACWRRSTCPCSSCARPRSASSPPRRPGDPPPAASPCSKARWGPANRSRAGPSGRDICICRFTSARMRSARRPPSFPSAKRQSGPWSNQAISSCWTAPRLLAAHPPFDCVYALCWRGRGYLRRCRSVGRALIVASDQETGVDGPPPRIEVQSCSALHLVQGKVVWLGRDLTVAA